MINYKNISTILNIYSITDVENMIFNIECAISSLENLSKCSTNSNKYYNFELMGQHLPISSNSVQISIPLPLNLVYDNLIYLKSFYMNHLNLLYKHQGYPLEITELNTLKPNDVKNSKRVEKIKKLFE